MAIITTKSTAEEIDAYFSSVKETLNERFLSKIQANRSQIMRMLKASNKECTSDPKWASHITVNGVRITQQPLGVYMKKERGGLAIGANTFWVYVLIKDLETAMPALIFYSRAKYAVIVEAHALARYRERFLKDTSLDFQTVAQTLLSRNAIFHHITNFSFYGSKEHSYIFSHLCRDGVFLGYRDTKTNVNHFCTFIRNDMLNDRQYYHNKENVGLTDFFEEDRKMRELADFRRDDEDFHITLMKEQVSDDGKTTVKEMTTDEIRAMVQAIGKDPQGYRERVNAEIMRQKREHQMRYHDKMMRKGYK